MTLNTKESPNGTVKRTLRITPEELPFLKSLALERGWIIEDIDKSVNLLKSIPRKAYSKEEMDIIEKEIIDEIKAYRHGN